MTTENQSQLPDERLEDIVHRRDEAARITKEKGWIHSQSPSWRDVNYLLSLLQQATTSERCVKCKHDSGVDERGICQWIAPTGIAHCLCKCVFPATGAGRIPAATPPANVAEGQLQHHKLCSIWTGSTSGLRN